MTNSDIYHSCTRIITKFHGSASIDRNHITKKVTILLIQSISNKANMTRPCGIMSLYGTAGYQVGVSYGNMKL